MRPRTILAILFFTGFFLMKCSKGWPLGGGILLHKDLGGGKEILIEETWRIWALSTGYSTRLWYRAGPDELWAQHWIHFDDQKRWTEEPEVTWSHGVEKTTLQVFYKDQRRGYFHLRVPAKESTWRNLTDFDLDPKDQPAWPIGAPVP